MALIDTLNAATATLQALEAKIVAGQTPPAPDPTEVAAEAALAAEVDKANALLNPVPTV